MPFVQNCVLIRLKNRLLVVISVDDENDPPTVNIITPSLVVDEGMELPNPYSISDPNGDDLTYVWTSSSGATSTSADPGILFADQTDGWMEVEVTDSQGLATQGERIPVFVRNVPPSLTGTLPNRVSPETDVELSLSVFDPGLQDSPEIDWNFGDGSTAKGAKVKHSWESGEYTIVATARDKDGATSVYEHKLSVASVVVDAGEDRDVARGKEVAFDFSASTSIDSWLSYRVDFGDGNWQMLSTLTGVKHTYQEEGDYEVTVRAIDRLDGDREFTDSATVHVRTETMIVAHAVPGTVHGDSAQVQATVWDAVSGQVLPGIGVTFTTSTQEKVASTGDDGRAIVQLTIPQATSDPLAQVTASIAADARHRAATTTANINKQVLPAGDIVFLIDESESMGSSQEAVGANVSRMAEHLSGSIDYSFGLWGFGGTPPEPRLATPMTTDLDAFGSAIEGLRKNGGYEPGTDAIVEALSPRTGWRLGAGQCVVLIGDEELQTQRYSAEDAAEALSRSQATLFTITTAGNIGQGYRDLALGSGGRDFDIEAFKADPTPVLDALLQSCVTQIVQRPDLSVSIDDSLDEVAPGQEQTYTVRARNAGTATAAEVVVRVELPAEITVVDPGGAAVSGRVLTWNVGDLASGSDWTRSVVVRTGEGQEDSVLEAVARIAGDASNGADPTPGDTIDTDVTHVRAAVSPSPSPPPHVHRFTDWPFGETKTRFAEDRS